MQADDPETFGSLYSSLDDAALDEFIDGLASIITKYRAWLKPITAHDLLETLADFADMLNVSAPSEGGLDLYLAAMDDVPANLMPIARIKVAKNHRYARLPLPKDFSSAIAGEVSWCENRIAWIHALNSRFHRARNLRAASRRISQ